VRTQTKEAYRVDTINYGIFLPLYAAGHGSFSQLFAFLTVLKNAAHFGAPKYPKRFVNPAMSPSHNSIRIKKTAALRFVFNFF